MEKCAIFIEKSPSARGSAPRPHCPRRLGALPSDPQPPADGGSASRPSNLEFLATPLPVCIKQVGNGHAQKNIIK